MTRISGHRLAALLLLAATGILPAAEVQAQAKVPVEQDLRRADQLERRIDAARPPRLDRDVTPGNPGGVAGFSGPPGTVGDSVNSYGPLPPGAAGNED